MVTTVRYLGETTRGPSPNLWFDCPWLDLVKGVKDGAFFFDDFVDSAVMPAATNTTTFGGHYAAYEETDVRLLSTGVGGNQVGVVQISGNDADNDQMNLTLGDNVNAPWVITDPEATTKVNQSNPLWFECRWKSVTGVADNTLGMFIGLGGPGLAATGTLVDNTGGPIATSPFIGFNVLHANGDALRFIYQEASDTLVIPIADMTAPTVIDTWYKLGFKFDPNAGIANRIKIYLDGVEQATYVTQANLATSTFPSDTEMTLLWANKVGSAVEHKQELDWWRIAQVYETPAI